MIIGKPVVADAILVTGGCGIPLLDCLSATKFDFLRTVPRRIG